ADGGFRGGDGEDEEHEYLPRRVAEEVREADEVQVHREQHQLDRHEQPDQVPAVEEDADDAHRKEHRAEHQVVGEADRHCFPLRSYSFSAGMDTSRTRSLGLARTCSAGSCARWSLRRRSVSEIAAMIATSRITAAVSKANR